MYSGKVACTYLFEVSVVVSVCSLGLACADFDIVFEVAPVVSELVGAVTACDCDFAVSFKVCKIGVESDGTCVVYCVDVAVTTCMSVRTDV